MKLKLRNVQSLGCRVHAHAPRTPSLGSGAASLPLTTDRRVGTNSW